MIEFCPEWQEYPNGETSQDVFWKMRYNVAR